MSFSLDGGVSLDGLMADALAENFDYIERIDRLTTIAEGRRKRQPRELDRRREVLGETLRRSVQDIEDGEFEVIETTPAKEKKRLDERAAGAAQARNNPLTRG